MSVDQSLERAFPPHSIDPEGAFAEWGGTYVDAEAFRRGVRGKKWPDLDATFLERHHDALVFLGPHSIADYIPAYLAAVVRRAPELDAAPGFLLDILTRRGEDERFDARFARLTREQQRAVAHALEAYEREVAGSSRQADVTSALDSFWRAHGGGAG